jgi:hypothetical protein
MRPSHRRSSTLYICETALLLCLVSSTALEAQSSPSVAQTRSESKAVALSEVPVITHRPLAPSQIPTGGAAPALSCFLQDNVNVIEIDGKRVEVHHCDSGGASPTQGSTGGLNGAGGTDGAAAATLTGVPTDPEICQLFATALRQECAASPVEGRAACQYNACIQEAKCLGQPTAQCGPKPKTISPLVIRCSNKYAANFNACTGRFRKAEGQNSCLYAARKALDGCMTSS